MSVLIYYKKIKITYKYQFERNKSKVKMRIFMVQNYDFISLILHFVLMCYFVRFSHCAKPFCKKTLR